MTRAYKALPPASELWERFDYKPLTGELVRKNGHRTGSVNPSGYTWISINRDRFSQHRLVWKWVTSQEPSMDIDHKKHYSTKDQFWNLRLATISQNLFNRKAKGFEKLPSGRYRTQIRAYGKTYRYGPFDTEAEARAAYEEASKRLHGEFSSV